MSDAVFTLPAFAKINWTLRVLGRRTDHLHELRTVFQTVTLHDRLKFALRADDRFDLTCDASNIPTGEDNLVTRAALALRDRYPVKRGASVHLEKRIPAGGGLGGGSSDAAVALLGLARLWRIQTDQDELAEIGARLGADVPFFFTGGTALGTGLGTRITPLPDATAEHLLIVTPNLKVSTAAAYASLNAPALTKGDDDIMLSISRADAQIPANLQDALHNDFEPVIFRAEPEIERVKSALLLEGARGALLAGSGSSVFGIFDNKEAQKRAGEALGQEEGWRIFPCAALARGEYFKSLGPCSVPLRGALS